MSPRYPADQPDEPPVFKGPVSPMFANPPAGYRCLLCGWPGGRTHDDAACAAKVDSWKATGPFRGGFGEYLESEIADLRVMDVTWDETPIRVIKSATLDSVTPDGRPSLSDVEWADQPAIKLGAYLPISHEALCDYTDHVCTDACPQSRPIEPAPFHRRALARTRRALRRLYQAVTGLRVVHKSRICTCDDGCE